VCRVPRKNERQVQVELELNLEAFKFALSNANKQQQQQQQSSGSSTASAPIKQHHRRGPICDIRADYTCLLLFFVVAVWWGMVGGYNPLLSSVSFLYSTILKMVVSE
jgi:hypothetical protein